MPAFVGLFEAYFVLCLFLLLIGFCVQWGSVSGGGALI